MRSDIQYLPDLNTYDEYMPYLQHHSYEYGTHGRSSQLQPLTTYMLETAPNRYQKRTIQESFPAHIKLIPADDTLLKVYNTEQPDKPIGLLEILHERYPVLHTLSPSDTSDLWVNDIINNTPWVDRVWLSSEFLSAMWEHICATMNQGLYTGIGFEHDCTHPISKQHNLYNSASYSERQGHQHPLTSPCSRESTIVYVTDQIGQLTENLNSFSELCDPLRSLTQLRIPSADPPGSHCFNYDGKVTNFSKSFTEHRSTISNIIQVYRNVTETAETKLWMWSNPVEGGGYRLDGVPVVIQLEDELSEDVFRELITYGFQDKEQYRKTITKVGGFVHRRGKTQVHISAIDKHRWQPFIADVSASCIIMMLPKGFCGNSIHRIIVFLQRFVTPRIKVFFGEEKYQDAIKSSIEQFRS